MDIRYLYHSHFQYSRGLKLLGVKHGEGQTAQHGDGAAHHLGQREALSGGEEEVDNVSPSKGRHGSLRAQHEILQFVVQIEGHAANEIVQQKGLLVAESLHIDAHNHHVCMHACMSVPVW